MSLKVILLIAEIIMVIVLVFIAIDITKEAKLEKKKLIYLRKQIKEVFGDDFNNRIDRS